MLPAHALYAQVCRDAWSVQGVSQCDINIAQTDGGISAAGDKLGCV